MGRYHEDQRLASAPNTEAASSSKLSNASKRALRWAAPVALAGALSLAACGHDDDGDAVRVAAASSTNGSDKHLINQAEDIARRSTGNGSDQHLTILAEEIARRSAGNGSDQHLINQAVEIARRSTGEAGHVD